MLTVQIICIGNLKERYWKDACAEYCKRLSAFCRVQVVELPESRLPESPSEAQIRKAMEEEGERILQKAGNSVLLPLCIEGTQVDSPGLSSCLEELMVSGVSAVSFVIGGSFGLADEVKRRGRKRLSMSKMTFPHQLARVMLLEQVYRAFMILNHAKYHK